MSEKEQKKAVKPKAKQVAPEGHTLQSVPGSVMQMEVPKDEPVNAAEARAKEAKKAKATPLGDPPEKKAKANDNAPEKPVIANVEVPEGEGKMHGASPIEEPTPAPLTSETLEAEYEEEILELLGLEPSCSQEELLDAALAFIVDRELTKQVMVGRVPTDEERDEWQREQDAAMEEYRKKQARRDAQEQERHAALIEAADSLQEVAFQLRIMNGIRLKDELQNNKTKDQQRAILDHYASFGRDFD